MRSILTVVTPAQIDALATLGDIKDELGIEQSDTSNDIWLQSAARQVSSAMQGDVSRVFPIETVKEEFLASPRFRTRPPATLRLARWPVVKITSLTENGNTLTEGTDFKVDTGAGIVYRLNGCSPRPWVWRSLVVVYAAGYAAVSVLNEAVPSVAPYTITPDDDDEIELDMGVTFSDGTPLTVSPTAAASGQYVLAEGVYSFNLLDAGKPVVITNAVSQIPGDLVGGAVRLVTARYRAKGRDPALIQRDQPGMGTERYWFGVQPGQDGQFPPEIAEMLERYRPQRIG